MVIIFSKEIGFLNEVILTVLNFSLCYDLLIDVRLFRSDFFPVARSCFEHLVIVFLLIVLQPKTIVTPDISLKFCSI